MLTQVPGSYTDRSYELFPAGIFAGDFAGAKSKQFDSGDVNLNLSFENTSSIESEEDPNGRTFTGQIAMIRDGKSAVELTAADFDNKSVNYGLKLAAGILAGLAEGVGAAERDPETNLTNLDLAAFAEAIQEGTYAGTRVRFEVEHRDWTSKNTGKSGTSDDLRIVGKLESE